ncbi:MAG: UDP-3-O-[3-hydroxymyristoyl] N-acetylglucosamine deacetylase [Thermoanaerobaculia bacterium]|nr:UDP-3-O-[3-hydroxymyristoyl] N-acetylglucosamine deacetylase [Thermoanaerobaculia bacterium]
MRAQTTLKTSVSIEGVGLHSGHPVRAHFRPAPAGHGLVFHRLDQHGVEIPARLESATTFDYATTLAAGGSSIGTVEHVLSAAYGEGLDNCRIEIEGPEVPILDGSALPFVRLFHAAGFERQDAPVRPLRPASAIEVSRGDRHVAFEPDGPGLTITYEIDFPHPVVGRQELTVQVRPEEYGSRIAPARTFGFLRDVQAMRERGLARGGTLHNAVVLDDTGVASGPLRFRDEFVRHKILDLLGDLALLGAPLEGRIHARRAGHALHIEFARALASALAGKRAPAAAEAEPRTLSASSS